MIFETVEILVSLAAKLASIRFVFFHAKGAGVGGQGLGINDGEGAVFVCGKLLRIVAML